MSEFIGFFGAFPFAWVGQALFLEIFGGGI
jgi:hypothetical protein